MAFSTSPPEKAARAQALLDARYAFVQKFGAEKGWGTDPTKFTIDQILEMREQPGWKNPLGEEKDAQLDFIAEELDS